MRKPPRELIVQIDSLDAKGQGVGREEGKMVFAEDALPGEVVRARSLRNKTNYRMVRTLEVLKSSTLRTRPRCPHYGVCGGCALQHMEASAQVAHKQRMLEEAFESAAGMRPEQMLAPIHGPDWGYRHRARLSVRYVAKKGEVLVGFHERKSSYIADIRSCEVLPPQVSALLLPLRALIASMDGMERLPQIEVAVGADLTALVLRHLEPLSDADQQALRQFAQTHGVQWWLQPAGPDSIHLLDADDTRELAYKLPEFGLNMVFRPTDFTQVNPAINRVMVRRAVNLLDPKPHERILDLFCGLGNFTLPLARQSVQVLGLEGSETLVQRARDGAAAHGLTNASFEARDLFEMTPESLMALGRFDAWLIDPAREGALAVVEALAEVVTKLDPSFRPRRIVYVSCNPATLARDAAVLHHKAGFQLKAAGVINMFAHTNHVESIAVFE
ncbi:23S rRNA (uracil(1939)-C(5))-methyltransferase RlmD [Orrella sp. 11846]|uniref:23S rRNA (uracil(1939)-C(5))-methyltransferase RlmD n=1 Tax=Orrella sp. 11846 TaxID=3409913 RepID=UPI003B5A3C9F